MAIFRKDPREVAYAGGRKHWTDVIKNSGPSNALIWRQPEEDFNNNSTLIVMPGEEAVFVKNGEIVRVFENGTYKLDTQNYPFISRLVNAFSGGISAFNCVVYFVKTTQSMEILWGTDSPIQVRDKLLGVATKLRARGAYKVRVDNASLFFRKMIGNGIQSFSSKDLDNYFINEFQSKIKTVVAQAVNESDMELLGIDSRLDELSDLTQPYFQNSLSEYGLKCINFSISAIDIEDDELRRKYDEIGMDAIETARKARGEKAAIDILGDDWISVKGASILKDLANNPGAGGIAAAGAGMGMGIGAAGAFGVVAENLFSSMKNDFSASSSENYSMQTSDRFVQEGASFDQGTQQKSTVERFKELKELLEIGALTPEEFEQKRKEILGL